MLAYAAYKGIKKHQDAKKEHKKEKEHGTVTENQHQHQQFAYPEQHSSQHPAATNNAAYYRPQDPQDLNPPPPYSQPQPQRGHQEEYYTQPQNQHQHQHQPYSQPQPQRGHQEYYTQPQIQHQHQHQSGFSQPIPQQQQQYPPHHPNQREMNLVPQAGNPHEHLDTDFRASRASREDSRSRSRSHSASRFHEEFEGPVSPLEQPSGSLSRPFQEGMGRPGVGS